MAIAARRMSVDDGDRPIDRARWMLGSGIFVWRGRSMSKSQLREKLRKIETLFAGASTTGERIAAEAALGSASAPAWQSMGGEIRQSKCSSRCRIAGRGICFSLLSALRIGAISLSSPATQHDDGPRAQRLH